MKISILIEGKTELVFMPKLREFLIGRLSSRMPRLDPVRFDGRIPTGEKLSRQVQRLLSGREPADAVIALTDVYTGGSDFINASDAKQKMRNWVGQDPRFYPHVALHDFEAWLIPFWEEIQHLTGSNQRVPSNQPESINHLRPPARVLAELFMRGPMGRKYIKTRDAARILRNQNIAIAATVCPELKAFLNTILTLSGASTL
jgi:hypothetical protein